MHAVGEAGGTKIMKREAILLNLLCIIAALAFVGLAIVNALTSGSF